MCSSYLLPAHCRSCSPSEVAPVVFSIFVIIIILVLMINMPLLGGLFQLSDIDAAKLVAALPTGISLQGFLDRDNYPCEEIPVRLSL